MSGAGGQKLRQLGEPIFTARDVTRKNGPAPEGPSRGNNHMLKVAERPGTDKSKPVHIEQYHTISGIEKMSRWLDEKLAAAKGGVITEIVKLTPDLAQALLGRNPGNRKLREKTIDKMVRDITEGNWEFNGESIIVADDGNLNDGQHRCAAVVKARRPIEAVMVIGATRKSRTTLDQGINRQISDYLSMQGHADAVDLGAAAGFAWQIDKYGMVSQSPDFRPTKGEVLAYLEEHGGLKRSLARIPKYGVRKVGGRPILAYLHWTLCNWTNPHDADVFIETLIGGENLKRGNPVLYVRNRLIDGIFRTPGEKIELLFRGWNAHRREETVTRIPVMGGRLPDLEP
jgi:hypothetical protein